MTRTIAPFTLALACIAACTEPAVTARDASAPSDASDASVVDAPAPADTLALPLACAPANGTPRDLVPYARLVETNTATVRGFGFVREAVDALATIRDDDPANGWVPAPGGLAVAAIDLHPWLGRVIALHDLTVVADVALPPGTTVALTEFCGGPTLATFALTGGPTATLDLRETCAGCVEVQVHAIAPLRVRAINLTSRDETLAFPDPSAAPAMPAHTFADHGVIEGFYGAPWSWRERRAMVLALEAGGMDTYVYAPKNDPRHRDRWREPYTPDEIAQFDALRAFARAHHVRFRFGLSPFRDFVVTDGGDYETLRAKLAPFADGPDGAVVLLADDIEGDVNAPVDGALGRLHADVIERLRTDLGRTNPALAFWFVGTVYSDERLATWAGGGDYLRAIGAVDRSVSVMWTGPRTSEPTLRASDFDAVRALLGRRPVLWDNQFANDGNDGLLGRLLLGPYTGRAADLPDALSGMVLNPSIQGSLDRVSVGTFVAWRNALDGTEGSWIAASVQAEQRFTYGVARDGTHDGALLATIARVFEGDAARLPEDHVLTGVLARVTAALDAGNEPSSSDIALARRELATLGVLDTEVVHSGLDADMVDELVYPLVRVSAVSRAGLLAFESLALRHAGGDASTTERAIRELLATAQRSRSTWISTVESFVERVGRETAREPATTVTIARRVFGHVAANVGVPLVLPRIDGAAVLDVHGLPGATSRDGVISWTPPYAGRWTAIALGTATDGSHPSTTEITVDCSPRAP